MDLTLNVWRQAGPGKPGRMVKYEVKGVNEHASFLEMLDVLNQELERAGRVADFFELAELMCIDALARDESCGGHLREEHQTPEGEALRDDKNFSYVSAWGWNGVGKAPALHKEPLEFEHVKPSQRSYK